MFIFEKLDVWQRAVGYADEVLNVTEELQTSRNHFRLMEQIESASTSVAMNIAEGKGRYSKKEFAHFLYIARGSLYETITLLRIMEKRSWISNEKVRELDIKAAELAKMLNGLINSLKKSADSS